MLTKMMGNTGMCWAATGLYLTVLGFTGLYWALLGWAGGTGDPGDPGGRDDQPG